MKKIISITIIFFIFASFLQLNAQWARTYGGSEIEYCNSIYQTTDGGYIVAGSTASFGSGDLDLWVLKLTSTGNIEWQHAYGGTGADNANSIQQTSDGGYIIAGYTASFGAGGHDFWVLKLDSTGVVEWQKTYGETDDDVALSIQQTSDEGYVVAGSVFSFDGGGYDSWVLKLTPTGDIVWQCRYEGSSLPECVTSIQQTSDEGYVIAGKAHSLGAGDMDFWVLKLSSNGDIEWQNTYGGIDTDEANSIQQTSDGGYIVAGWTRSFRNEIWEFWILKLTSEGDIEWQRTYGEGSQNVAECVRQTIDGGYIVAGHAYLWDAGGYNFWVLKLTSTGDIEWERIYDGGRDEEAHSIQQTNDGGYVVAGFTTSYGAGDWDLWILKLFPDGNIDPTCGFISSSIATITDTSVSPNSTSIVAQDTNVVPLDTIVTPCSTNAITSLVCDGPKYDLAISAAAGGTTNPSPGTNMYYIGTVVQIEAIPDTGYKFSYWTGDISSGQESDNPITITVDGEKSIIANFVIQQYTLSIAATSGGTTDPSPGIYTHDFGTHVNIKAMPNSGCRFIRWDGDASGSDNPIAITLDSNKSIMAYFFELKEEDENLFELPCFIATAAYGSPFHPHVKIIRDFRDKFLKTNSLGRKFVYFYYKYSPLLANIIAKSKPLKVIVRIHLVPFILLSYSMVHLGLITTAGILLFVLVHLILFIWLIKRIKAY